MADSDTIVSAWNQDRPQTQAPTNPPSRRVCAACRRRKVGCDKRQPCQHCKKSATECVYPPDNNPDLHLIRDTQLLEQLHRLEPMFKTLADCMEQGTLPGSIGASLSSSRPNPSNKQPSPTPPTPPQSVASASTSTGNRLGNRVSASQQTPSPQSLLQETDSTQSNPGATSQETSGLAWSPYGTSAGKLVMDDGRQRYVSGTFWEALHNENDPDEAMLSDDASDLDEDPSSRSGSLQYALIFNSCGQGTNSESLHPPRHQRLRAWQLFKANVHPVATVLHIPSVEPMVLEAMQNLRDLAPNLEALLFVVYFGATNSLSADDCQLQFISPQSALLAKFRRGADSALARSRLMETDDLLTLQVFVVYLVLLRSRDPTYSWNMTGLAVRLAQALGVHRDGSTLNLSPFDTEMRRRLWWGICILDTPASEDYSCSTGLLELSSFDSKPPLNVDDADLYAGMTEYPNESQAMTDMSFTAARCWASNIWRTMIDTRRVDPSTGKSFKSMAVAEKQVWVDNQRQQIMSRFSGDKNSREPLHCLVTSFVGTIISNLRLMVLSPLTPGGSLTEDQRRSVFQHAIDCMTHSYRLRTDPMLSHWSWLSKCYNEWHAFAVILAELSSRPLIKDADKAWRVVEQSAVLRWDSSTKHRRVHQWRSVMNSIDKARRRRRKELERRKSASSVQSSTRSRGQTAQGGFWPGPSVVDSQTNQTEVAMLTEQDAQGSMYQVDKTMGPLLGADDICNFSGDDGQLYFV